jgi:hypothetical protein
MDSFDRDQIIIDLGFYVCDVVGLAQQRNGDLFTRLALVLP